MVTEFETSKQNPLRLLMLLPTESPFNVDIQLTLLNLNVPELNPPKSNGKLGFTATILPVSSVRTMLEFAPVLLAS